MQQQPDDHRGTVPRRLEVVRGGWGLVLLLAPRVVLHRMSRTAPDHRALVVARVLGARQLAQAVASGRADSPAVLRLGVAADTAHALTGVGLALLDSDRARPALADAAVAGCWALLGHRWLARHPHPRWTAA